MLSDLARHILEELLRPCFEQFMHFIGRIIVGILSFGTIKCDPFHHGSTWKSHRRKYGWLGLYRRDRRSIALSGEFTSVIGLAPFIALILWLCFFHSPH
jgi:hypothetical protein